MTGIIVWTITARAKLHCNRCDATWTSDNYQSNRWADEVKACEPAFALGWRIYAGGRSLHAYCPDHSPSVPMRLLHGQESVQSGESIEQEDEAQTWIHQRKGRITGRVVRESNDGKWTNIRLVGDHELRYGSRENRGRIDEDGEVMTVRKSFLRRVCPVHDIPDCSPLLNGCSLLTAGE